MDGLNYRDSLQPAGSQIVISVGTRLKEVEKAVILETLKQQRYNRTRTAMVLGIGIRTLQRKLKQYASEEQKSSQQLPQTEQTLV